MQPTRVLHVLYKLETAGAEKVVYALAKRADRRRLVPIVCAFKDGRMSADFRRIGVPVRTLGKRGPGDMALVRRLVRLLRDERVDVVHTHGYSPGLWGRVAGLLAGTAALVHTEHTLSEGKGAVQRWTDRVLFPRTERVVAVSREVRRSLARCCGLPEVEVEVIYNGVEDPEESRAGRPARALALRREFGFPEGKKIVLTVGRLEEPKGHRHLLEAARALRRQGQEMAFVWAGGGSLREELEGLTRELGLGEDVRFVGFREDIADLMAFADVVAVPSTREGFSITVLEAMASGKPIVATAVGGNAEAIVHGESGLIVPPGDCAQLSAAIRDLTRDDGRSRALGLAARSRYEALFSVAKMVRRTEDMYDRCLREGSQSRQRPRRRRARAPMETFLPASREQEEGRAEEGRAAVRGDGGEG